MKLSEAITGLDARKHNTCTYEEKLRWLTEVDGMIHSRILNRYAPGAEAFEGYGPDTPGTRELLVGAPYDSLYLWWLEACVDHSNAEFTRYNNAIARFNHLYGLFADHYLRTHQPLTVHKGFV